MIKINTIPFNISYPGSTYLINDFVNNNIIIHYGLDSNYGLIVRALSNDYGRSWYKNRNMSSSLNVYYTANWYDRWSGIEENKIHYIWYENDTSKLYYKNYDVVTGADSSTILLYTGTSASIVGYVSITKSRGGNLIVAYCIDAGVEYGCLKSTDNGANWSSINTGVWEASAQDQVILLPGWADDNQDIMAFFWDASANEISKKMYDDSADSWSEVSIATSMVDYSYSSNYVWPCFSAAVDLANNRNLLVAWTAHDTLNADLRCWHITESTNTEVTNVVLNSGDDQGACCISINYSTGDWYVFYFGKSDGSETYNTNLNLYYKISKDQGTTWGDEIKLSMQSFYYGRPRHILVPQMFFNGLFVCVIAYAFTTSGVNSWIFIDYTDRRTYGGLGL